MNTEKFTIPVHLPHLPVKPNPTPTSSTFTSIFIPAPEKDPEKYISLSDIRKDFQSIIDDSDCPSYIAARIGLAIELLPHSDVIPVQFSHWVRDTREVPVTDHWFFKWFKKETKTIQVVKCSNCGTQRRAPLKYCSNCGCKMNKKIYNA